MSMGVNSLHGFQFCFFIAERENRRVRPRSISIRSSMVMFTWSPIGMRHFAR